MSNKVAVVLGGGGAKGAFQVGALTALREAYPNVVFDIYAGVSVGCLNGGMMAMDKFDEMCQLWNSITDDSIYTGKGIFRMLYSALTRKSAYSNAPLAKILTEHFDIAQFKRTFLFGVTSLDTGKYYDLSPTMFHSNEELVGAVLASTAIPIVWPPVPDVTLFESALTSVKLKHCVDGGLRNVTPVGDVLAFDPTHVIVINCSRTEIWENENSGNNILTIAERSLAEIAINQNVVSDIANFIQINRLVKQAEANGVTLTKENGNPYVSYSSMIIEPTTDLGDSLDFSQQSIQRRIKDGKAATKAVLSTLSAPFFI